MSREQHWDLVLTPKNKIFSFRWKELWQYRDLINMFVKRDIVTVYKQTVLGPIWFIIQPVLTTLMYVLVFGSIAGISTDGLPKILFYLSGVVIWNYFSDTFNTTSRTFIDNANIFGKVYFPRLAIPLSKVVSGLIKFLIQFLFFIGILLFYIAKGSPVHPNVYILTTPILLMLMAGLGLGFGIIFTSLTTKYRDLVFLIQFGVQLAMYATPVIFPVSSIPEKYKPLIMANPMTSIIEAFRFAYLGEGAFLCGGLAYSFLFTILVLFFGVLLFNRVERTFMDTV